MREYIKQALRLPPFEEWSGSSFGTAKQFRDYDLYLAATFPTRHKIYKFLYGIHLKTQFGRRLTEAKYWVYYRFHPKHKYTTIKLKRLDPGYYDECTLLKYAMFEIFEGFMKRQGGSLEPYEHDEQNDGMLGAAGVDDRNEAHAALNKIYDWWVNVRPNRSKELPEFPDLPKDWGVLAPLNDDLDNEPLMQEWKRVSDQHSALRKKWAQEDIDMMQLLIKYHRLLWD